MVNVAELVRASTGHHAVSGRVRAEAMRRRALLLIALLGLTVAAAGIAQDAGNAMPARTGVANDPSPTPFRLIFEGARTPDTGASNIQHRGVFTATAPVCATGDSADREYFYPSGAVRENTCADGSGSFTTIVEPLLAERGGAGTWKIVGGTRQYVGLRGQGAFTGEFVSGSPSDDKAMTFRSTWNGFAGFDVRAPKLQTLRASATRIRPRSDLYRLRVAFEARDDLPTNAVQYRVLATSGSYLVSFAQGSVSAEGVAVTLRLRPRRPDLPLIVEIRVGDPLGNERRVLRSVPLQG